MTFDNQILRRLVSLESQVKGMRRSSHLGHSSFVGSIDEKDADGNLVSRTGQQHDGTHGSVVLDGPIPPAPSTPLASTDPGLVTVAWDGTHENGAPTPLDHYSIEVYAAPEPFAFIEGAELVAVMVGEDGSRVTVSRAPGEWSLGLVAVSRAGKRSSVSDTVAVEVPPPSDPALVQEAIDAGAAAQNAADVAAAAAAAAEVKADEAEAAAAEAAGVAAGKGRVIIAATAPADEAGSLWIRTPDNVPHTWDGSIWVARTDQAALDAAALATEAAGAADAATSAAEAAQAAASDAAVAASAARASADGAITWSTAIPAGTPANPSALWFRVDGAGRVISQWEWTGATWVQRQIDNTVIANLDAGKITAGLLDAARIKAGSITVDKLLVGTAVNLAPDPGFDAPEAWSGSAMVLATGGRLAGGSLLIPQSSTLTGAYMATTAAGVPYAVPIVAGERYLLGGWVRFESAAPTAAGRAVLYVRWWNPATSVWSAQVVGASSPGGVAANTWTYVEAEVLAPASVTHLSVGAYKVAAHTTGAVRWDDVVVKAKVSGSLLVNGAIDGKTITGSTVRTSATVGATTSGQGFIVDANGARAHRADGGRTFNVDASTGEVSIAGSIQSDGPNHTIELGSKELAGLYTGSLVFLNKVKTERIAGLQLNSNNTSYWPLSIFSRDSLQVNSFRSNVSLRAGDGITRTSGVSGQSALMMAVEGDPEGGAGGVSLGYTRWAHSGSTASQQSASYAQLTPDGGVVLTSTPATSTGRPTSHLLIRDGYLYPYAAANASSPATQALRRMDLVTGLWQSRSGSTWTAVPEGPTAPVDCTVASDWYMDTGFATPTVRKVGNQVFFTGSKAKRSSALSVGGAGTYTVFTIPAGYRPAATQIITGAHAIGGNFFAGHWLIQPDGAVQFIAFASGTIAANSDGGFVAPGASFWFAA